MPRKVKIVISDTHIGAGGTAEGNKLDDFISDAEFVNWIHRLVEESNQQNLDMELIINGDWIEFLQIPAVSPFKPHHPYNTEAYLDLSDSAALQRLEIVYEWHPSIFLGLSDFLSQGSPRRTITILYGNHDPELAYVSVQKRLLEMIHAVGDDEELVTIGSRIYFQDGIYAEHGNAYVETVNRFSVPDFPFEPDDPLTVEHPDGSAFVTHFFNQVEWERPWIDGVHPVTSLVFYAIAFEPAFAVRVLKTLLKTLPDIISDIASAPATRAAEEMLQQQLDTPEGEANVIERLQTDPAYSIEFSQMVETALSVKGLAPAPTRGIAGAPLDTSPEVRAREISEHYWQMLEDEAANLAQKKGARVVLFGHIHERIEKKLVDGAIYLNTGTWVWKGDFSEASDDQWQDLIASPEKYMDQRELTYARIDLDEDNEIISARLLRVGDEPQMPIPPDNLPTPGLWAKIWLAIRSIFQSLTGE